MLALFFITRQILQKYYRNIKFVLQKEKVID